MDSCCAMFFMRPTLHYWKTPLKRDFFVVFYFRNGEYFVRSLAYSNNFFSCSPFQTKTGYELYQHPAGYLLLHQIENKNIGFG